MDQYRPFIKVQYGNSFVWKAHYFDFTITIFPGNKQLAWKIKVVDKYSSETVKVTNKTRAFSVAFILIGVRIDNRLCWKFT